MDHQLGSALSRRTLRQLRHLHSKNLERGRHHARFDAADETLVPIEHTQRAVEVDTALCDNIRHRGQTGLRYVQERNNFRMTMRHDVSRKTFEGRGSRTARIDDRCHARVYATDVRMNADSRAGFEDMRVQIDQAWRDDRARHLDDAPRLLARDRRRDMRNLALLDRNIVIAIATGFALAVLPVSAETITTDSNGLTVGEVKIPVKDGTIPGYRAMPDTGGPFPAIPRWRRRSTRAKVTSSA